MGEKHFEIIMSGRQMALAIASMAGLLLVVFGLGVTVGLLQPAGDTGQAAQEQAPLAVAEPELGRAPTTSDAWGGAPPVVDSPAPEVAVAPPELRPTAASQPPPGATVVATPAPTPALAPVPMPTPALALAPTGPQAPTQTGAAALPLTQTPTVAPAAVSMTPAATRIPPSPSPHPTARVAAAAGLWVQVGSLSQAQQGEGLKQRVIAMGFTPEQVFVFRAADGRWRVRVGPFPDEESAGRVLARIRPQGFPDAFLVRE